VNTLDLPWLSTEQRDHLIAYARRHGPGWQEKLDAAWLSPARPRGLCCARSGIRTGASGYRVC